MKLRGWFGAKRLRQCARLAERIGQTLGVFGDGTRDAGRNDESRNSDEHGRNGFAMPEMLLTIVCNSITPTLLARLSSK